jgi:hypothetical protein
MLTYAFFGLSADSFFSSVGAGAASSIFSSPSSEQFI